MLPMSFKINIKITTFTDNVPEKMTIPRITCDPCSNKNVTSEAVQYCYECQNNFCQQCMKTHNASFLHHSLTETGTLSFENSCAKHERNTLDFYCVEHDCLCCPSCIPEEHTSCEKLVPLKDAAKDILQSSTFQDVSNALSNITSTLDKAITSQDDNIECLENDRAKIFDQIASTKAVIIKRLDKLETKLKQDTNALKKEQKIEFESTKNYLLQMMKPTKSISDKINEVFKNGSHEQMFVLINKYKLEILYYENQLQEIMPTLETRRLTFKPPDHIQNPVKSLGSTRLRSLQYNAEYNPDYKRPKMEPVQIPSLVCQMPSKLTLDRKIEIKHSPDVWISNMGVTYDNRLLLCNFYSKDLLVYSDRGEYLQDCKLSGESWDIAIIHDDDIAVVTQPFQQSIQFINVKTMTAGSILYVPGDCYSICIANDTICVGGHKGYLYIVNKHGEHLKTMMLPDSGNIDYIHHGLHDSFYYIDNTRNFVTCVNMEGHVRCRYTSKDLKLLRRVITDKEGNIYLASNNSNTIQRLTPNLEFLDVIPNDGNVIGMVFGYDCPKLFVLNQVQNSTFLLSFTCS